MIPRRALAAVQGALSRQAAVALLGPRQVGKTTLAHSISAETPSLYLDLEASEDRAKLADPALFLSNYEDRLVVLDEIHRVPELFPALRGIIDRGRRHGRKTSRFLILGPRVPAETLERLWTMLAHEQAALLNASRLAAALMIGAQTVTRYVDLLVDLLLVRRLRPFHGNVGKRLVKSPKVFVRDSGIVHGLLGISDYNALSGHPVAGASWEGFVIENLVAAVPSRTIPGFYRTAAGAEIDLLLEIPGHGLWAFDIKRGLSAKPEKGFYVACEDLKPQHRFLVNSGRGRHPISPGLDAIGLVEMAGMLASL